MSELRRKPGPRPNVLKEGRECQRVHVWLYSEDVRWIDVNMDKVKRSKFVRLCVQKIIWGIQAKAGDTSEIIVATKEPEEDATNSDSDFE